MNNQYSNYGSPLYGNDFVTPNQYTAPKAESYRTEQSYIENILRLNRGKMVRIHMTFPDSVEFRDREFTAIIEQSGRDHIILSEPDTGKWQLLLMIYVDFITFDEKINYLNLN